MSRRLRGAQSINSGNPRPQGPPRCSSGASHAEGPGDEVAWLKFGSVEPEVVKRILNESDDDGKKLFFSTHE